MKILFLILTGIMANSTSAQTPTPITPIWWDLGPYGMRDKINQRIMNTEAPVPKVGSVEDRVVEREGRTTPIRIYSPGKGERFPVVLMIHGGAWIAGSIETHDNMARYLCSQSKAAVVSVGYLNSPEGKFPLPLEQCYDSLLWTVEHAKELSIDATRVAVAGDSAGGNMGAVLCLMARDRSGPKLVLQVLINPAPDLTCDNTFERKKGDPILLDFLKWQAVQYLSDPSEMSHPYVSPMVAKNLKDLPPAVVLLAENDEFRESGQKYADRLKSFGVPTQVYCQKGIGHLAADGSKASLKARESLDVAVTALQKAFSKSQ